MKLLTKITLFVLSTLILLLSIFSYIVIKDEKETLSSLLTQQGELLAKTVSAASVEIMLVEDYPVLDSYLLNISTNYKSIDFIEIIKEEKVVSSIKNPDSNESNKVLEIFSSNITIDGDILGNVKLGLTTAENDKIINKRIEQFLISTLVISILLFIMLLYIIKHYLLTYIEKLKVHTKLIGEGKYHKTLDINTKDEFEELSHSINTMTKNIDESHSNLKRLNLIQEQQKIELIEANKSKDDFLANMSHELKTPLNSINVISSVMMKNKDSSLSDKQVQNLSIINHCGNDLLFLINDVLDLSKLEAGEITLDNTTFNLNKLMLDIKNMIKPQAKDKNIQFVFEYEENIQFIYSDKQRIKQIVKNLLSNSLKFVKEGTIELIIKDLDDKFSITVKDNGIGIEKKKLENIFDRFKQADTSTTRKYGGTGLGLAICKELSTLLNGSIDVQSEINVGTTFTLTLPKNSNKVDKTPQKTIEVENDLNSMIDNIQLSEKLDTNRESKEEAKEKIILLNNDPLSFMALVIELKKSYEIIQVSSIEALQEKIKTNTYSLIIIDISKLSQNDLDNSLNEMENKLILVSSEDDNIQENIKNISILEIRKPLIKEEFISSINSIKK
ncbi:sensor histidine kinase [Poseidonibacter lekithochrous]|uniref:sensor histidine kinase n=1 Tax=Poseidonibacter lekithochrous TaxID=1904463 RepID=UPI0008FCA58E|nr:HAMP domain-containing sensor histidine kinase [Poseidonibacter lekithochrous]QKJ22938.1 two-component system sensor histidine kinase [Poseidonibacter lekithochrous]